MLKNLLDFNFKCILLSFDRRGDRIVYWNWTLTNFVEGFQFNLIRNSSLGFPRITQDN